MLLPASMFGPSLLLDREGGDDAVQVVQDLTVHLGQTLLSAGFGGGDQPRGLLPQTSAKCAEISPVVKPFAVTYNTILSMPVSRRWRFVTICDSKLLLVSTGTSISTGPISVNAVLGRVPISLTRAAAKFVE
jgi:hypothetical protein